MPALNNAAQIEKIEHERLFGEGVDLFKCYHACRNIQNVLSTIGVRTSKDNDWFRAVANFLTVNELSEIYDKLISPEKRRVLGASSKHRTPPEIDEDDPDDIVSYLSKNVLKRRKMWHVFAELYRRRVEEYEAALQNPERKRSATELRFEEMRHIFDLSDLEMRALIAIFLSATGFVELGDFDVAQYRNAERINALARTLGILDVEAAELMDDSHNIRKYGLVDEDLDLDRTFLSFLAGISSKPLAERFWTRYDGEVLPWSFHGKLAEKHGEIVKKMILAKTPETGVSVLLYGVPGSGKTSFAASLAKDMGRQLYFIAQNDDDNRRMSYSPAFRYAALAVAQKQLDAEECILVVDECDKMVENSSLGGGLFNRLFGKEVTGGRDGETKGQLNAVIDQSKHTILWICNSRLDAIDPSSRRRFDYNIYFDDLSATAREHVWRNALVYNNCEGRLDDFFISRVSTRYQVNAGGIAVAVKNAAALCRKDPAMDFEEATLTFLKAHCTLLGIQESPEEMLEPARDYSLEGLNIRSGIKLPRLIGACKKFLKSVGSIRDNRDRPRMNLLLFGVPGSGKTEFVKYLAKQLKKKLCIKNASDLLDSFVGATEQRIAAAFSEAEANDEILFIDEGDSLLGAREGAVRSWEVSQVNTLLSEMERFQGIFIVGTNLVQKLDQAAMRRFSFRLHFDYLTNEGKEIFFNTYFGKPMKLPELTQEEKNALFRIENMTPSDFRNVRQQFFYLEDEKLTSAEIIEALQAEIAGKNSGSSYKGLGQIVNKMGF